VTSAARIPKLEPATLDEDQRALYDAIAGGRRAQGPQLFRLADSEGRLEGPFNAFLLQPRLGSALQALGSAVRYDTGLDDRCREIAILIVAAHWESEFEWYAHEAVGRSVGLGDADLAARIREMAILVVAWAWDSGYERSSHEPIGRGAGLTEPEIEALRVGADPGFTDEQERVAYSVVRALTGPADLDDQQYAAAVAVLGEQALVELSALVGYYATLALQLRIFRVEPR